MSVERSRLFFALWPDARLQRQCADWVRDHLSGRTGRRLPAVNLHVTLAFIGEVDATGRACVESVADDVRSDAFTLMLDRVGYWRRPQVVWLGAGHSPPALIELAKRLREGLKRCEVEVDRRPFQAHMTVIRKAVKGPGVVPAPLVQWPVAAFVLVSAELRPEGACYRILRRWPLQK